MTSFGFAAQDLDPLNVVWSTPSADAAGSMPIGNGRFGANVWVEPSGDILLLLSRTDAWSEACRLLKLGRLRVRLDPNPLPAGPFRQVVVLREGRIDLTLGDTRLEVWIDPDHDVLWISGESGSAHRVEARLETWRTARRRLVGGDLDASWTMKNAPMPVFESGDVYVGEPAAVNLYHRNESSIVPVTLEHQSLDPFAPVVHDPLLNRTFGSRLSGKGFARLGQSALVAPPTRAFAFQVATASTQPTDASEWLREVRSVARQSKFQEASARRTSWWREFWSRSWIEIGGPSEDARRITQGYALQRWMLACGGRGKYPIKFNGSIFTVEPSALGEKYDPDWRRWGDCFWWQNTRLPYAPMVASGDFDLMESLWPIYEDSIPLARERTRAYHQARGAYFPETMTIFGTYSNNDYGWNRTGHKPSDVLCPWWQWTWNQGPEMLQLMLDRWEWSGDDVFLRGRVVPMARAVLDYFDSRFPRDGRGRLKLTPTQAVETYWNDVVNDTPSVAGLHAVLDRLVAIPASKVSAKEQAFWRRLRGQLPPIPVRQGKIMPAESYRNERSNVENPELYAIWPFRVYGVGRPGLDVARQTFRERIEKANAGWQYDGQCAALVGLTEDARATLIAKSRNSNPAYRWPATWGPNYDWLPDQTHGGNLMATLQAMLFQCVGRKIYVLPAWPSDWDVAFRLHASQKTLVEVEVRGGKVVRVATTPKSRLRDVVVGLPTP